MIDVLFVDDDETLAREWASLIRESMRIDARFTANITDALALVSRPGVRIVVIDYSMPTMTGVELGQEIARVDPLCLRVMLSGQAQLLDAVSAYDRGFERFVHKNQALEVLPDLVRQLLVSHAVNVEILKQTTTEAFYVRSGPLWRRVRMKFQLQNLEVLERDWVSEDSWRTQARVDAGVTKTETIQVEWSETKQELFEIQRTRHAELAGSAALHVKLRARLVTDIATRSQVSGEIRRTLSASTATTYQLPSEPQDSNVIFVKAREYQVAPTYLRLRLTVLAECGDCGMSDVWVVTLALAGKRYATRQIDYLSDNQCRETLTGFVDVP